MVSRGNVVSEILLLLQQTYTVTVFGLEKSFRIEITFNTMAYRATYGGPSSAIKAIRGLVALTALGMDWTEDDTVKTTMNGISNITFIKLRHACRTEVLKNGDGRTDGWTRLLFASPPVGQTGRGGSSGLTLRRLTMNPLNEN